MPGIQASIPLPLLGGQAQDAGFRLVAQQRAELHEHGDGGERRDQLVAAPEFAGADDEAATVLSGLLNGRFLASRRARMDPLLPEAARNAGGKADVDDRTANL